MSRRHYLSIIVAAAIAVSASTAARAAPAANTSNANASVAAKSLRSGLDLDGFDRSVRP